jgi:hypothetical protein
MHFSTPPSLYMHRPSLLPWFYRPNSIWWREGMHRFTYHKLSPCFNVFFGNVSNYSASQKFTFLFYPRVHCRVLNQLNSIHIFTQFTHCAASHILLSLTITLQFTVTHLRLNLSTWPLPLWHSYQNDVSIYNVFRSGTKRISLLLSNLKCLTLKLN